MLNLKPKLLSFRAKRGISWIQELTLY